MPRGRTHDWGICRRKSFRFIILPRLIFVKSNRGSDLEVVEGEGREEGRGREWMEERMEVREGEGRNE